MDGNTQPYHQGVPMGTDTSQMDEQDVSMFQRHGDMQQNFTGSSSQLGYTNLNSYSVQPLGQTSPNRTVHLGTLHDMYHSATHLSPYKPSSSSPVKPAYQGSVVDQFSNGTSQYKPIQPKEYTAIRDDPGLICANNLTSYKNPPLGITPPKGYTGRGSEYGGTVPQYKTALSDNNTSSVLTDQQQALGTKSAIYKPRHNISEKDLHPEEPDVGMIKSASKDYTETNLPRELMSKMFGLLKEGMFCDAILFAGNKEIRIHKLVLLAASPFLMSKMTNPTPGESIKVKLPSDIPIEVASQLVHYLYDGKVTLTTENVAQFARIAKLFNLEHLLNICEEFASSYKLGDSVLCIPNEDITVVVNEIPGAKAKKTLQSETEKVVKTINNSNTKETDVKSPVKQRGKELNMSDGYATKVNHVYGTRAASGLIKKKVFMDSFGGNDESTSAKISSKKSGFQNSVQNTDISVGKQEKNKGNMQNDDTKPGNDDDIAKHPRKRRLSLLTPRPMASEDDQAMSNTDYQEQSVQEEEEENSDENEEDYEPVTKITTQSGMQRAVFEGNRKGKTLKTLKKPPGSMYQNLKKGRQKKMMPLVPLTNKTETRPPPKKRAREFAEKEIKENSELLKSDLTSVVNKPASSTAMKKKALKMHRKNIRAVAFSTIGRYTTELEERALEIPESERQFKCNLCDNEFVFPKRCLTHVMKTHELSITESMNNISIGRKVDTPRSCDICGYVTKDQNYYYIHYHKYFRHGVPLPKGWKPYKCDTCGKECFTKFQLKDHKLIHTEETPFVCEQCGNGFKSRTCLNSHVYHKHSKERKHQCKECDRAFKTRTQLLVHNRTHTGEKPFHCPDCEYKSTTRGNMRLHLTNKHKYTTAKIRDLMSEIKPFVYDIDLDTSKEAEKEEKGTDNNSQIMVLNEQGQVEVLDDVKGVSTSVTNSQESSNIESVHPNITNLLSISNHVSQSHTINTTSSSHDNRHQYLLQQINIPINLQQVQEISGADTVPSQLLLPVDQFDQNQGTFAAQVQNIGEEASIQESNIVTGIEDVSNLLHGQRNMGHDDAQSLIELRQFGQELKGANNETVLQLIPLGRQNQLQVQDNSYTDKLDRPDSLQQVHVHNMTRDKPGLVHVHIQSNPHPSVNEDQMEVVNTDSNPKMKSSIALVPVSVQKQMTVIPSTVLNIAPKPDLSSLQNVIGVNASNTVAYVMRQQKTDIQNIDSSVTACHSQGQVIPLISTSTAQPIPPGSHQSQVYDVTSLLTGQNYSDPNSMYQQYQHYQQNY